MFPVVSCVEFSFQEGSLQSIRDSVVFSPEEVRLRLLLFLILAGTIPRKIFLPLAGA